jgi:leucyl-tRNA synthetase
MRNKINNDIRNCEASIKCTIINIELQVAKKMVSDALQKYETEKLNFFKAHLTDTLSDIEWKRSNFEMVETLLKQITVLQACEEKRVEEKQAEEIQAEEKRAEEKRAEEKRAEENRKNFEKVEIMIEQIAVLQNWMNETKIREEKRANAINAFLEERHKF